MITLKDSSTSSGTGISSVSQVTIKVGQGNIRERLKAHNTDPQIQGYAHLDLLVTWTSLPSSVPQRRGGLPRQGVETESGFSVSGC